MFGDFWDFNDDGITDAFEMALADELFFHAEEQETVRKVPQAVTPVDVRKERLKPGRMPQAAKGKPALPSAEAVRRAFPRKKRR